MIADPQPNYDYSGIGKAEALLIFSALAASPAAWLTNGVLGKFTFWALSKFLTWLSGKGIMLLNVLVADVQTLAQKGDFDGSFDNAFAAIHGHPERLTPEQKAAIDKPVIDAFRKFAVFGQLRDGGNT